MNSIQRNITIFLLFFCTSNHLFAKSNPPVQKILQVKKIVSCKLSDISKKEMSQFISYLNADSSPDKQSCEDSSITDLQNWLFAKRIKRQFSVEDTGNIVYDFPRNSNGPDKDVIDFYYVKQGALNTDSLIFIGHQWECPDYNKMYFYINDYSFLPVRQSFNYIGKNSGRAISAFSLKQFFWDNDENRFTRYTPAISANDSSSLLIYSTSGFRINYSVQSSLLPSDKEKKIILENMFRDVKDISCLHRITMEKLGDAGGISRFVGMLQIQNSSNQLNSLFIADIEKNNCDITIFEPRDGFYNTSFFCAYSIENNIADVYVWQSEVEGNIATPLVKEVIYKSGNRWVANCIENEYQGNCYTENDE